MFKFEANCYCTITRNKANKSLQKKIPLSLFFVLRVLSATQFLSRNVALVRTDNSIKKNSHFTLLLRFFVYGYKTMENITNCSCFVSEKN